MARVSTYLNFMGRTLEAFEFYASAFGTEFVAPPQLMGDIPPMEGMPPMSPEDQALVLHVELPILAGHVLMGTDMVESMGHRLELGNNVSINLEPDTRDEVDDLYAKLSVGGDPEQCSPPTQMFWGAYYATTLDRFGIRWMFNCAEAQG